MSGSVALIEPKSSVPAARVGLVQRNATLRRLLEATGARVVSIAAPAGYGKTTLLTQWAQADPRPFAWLTLDEHDNDPILLVGCLQAAIDRAGVGGPAGTGTLRATHSSSWSSMVPRLCAGVAAGDDSFVLVLDDLHALSAGESLDVIEALVQAVPPGSQLVLASRAAPPSLVARVRAEGGLLELGPTDLALTQGEAHELLSTLGLDITDDVVEQLVRRSEGWAAGLYLQGLGMLATDPVDVPPVTTVDRYVEDYFREVHLAAVSAAETDFLLRSSILERLSAGLCDAALARNDSARMLETLEQRYLFLVPLDRERTWYRYHELFRAALRRQLDGIDARAVDEIRVRAADWCEAGGLPEAAMDYAIAAGDTDRMARLFVSLAVPLYRAGRMATVEAWLHHFDDAEIIRRHPTVAILGAWAHTLRGNAFQADRWADAAERGRQDTRPLLDGSTSVQAWLVLLRALRCREGPEQMQADAELAMNELGPFSPFQGPARWLRANAILLRGDARAAEDAFEEAAAAAEASGAAFAGSNAFARRALFALDRDDMASARALLTRARALLPTDGYHDYSAIALLLVAEAHADIRAGDTEAARTALAATQRLRPSLSYPLAFYAVQVLAEMARAYLALGDMSDARAVLLDASDILRHRRDLGSLVDEIAGLKSRVGAPVTARSGWESSLTSAELRLLPLLTTHLTFREIGERLFISRNTVKTEAISIYRKLGASSRSEAVERAAELGLLDLPVNGRRITRSG